MTSLFAPPYGTLPGERPAMRAIGVDLSRCVVMLIVLFAHGVTFLYEGSPLVSPRFVWKMLTMAHYAVEHFFALSGFLIGGILLRDMAEAHSPRGVGRYLARRWLRTLPVYYVVLFLLLFVQGMQSGTWEIRWDYVFFVQNWPDGAGKFFPASWSLAVEQWAYIFLPIVVLFIPALFTRRGVPYHKALFFTMVGIIGLFVALRTCMAVLVLSPDSFDVAVRKQTHLRLDALLYGLLVAHCKLARPDWYRRLSTLPVFLTVMILLGLLIVFQYKDHLLEALPGGIPRFAFHAGLGLSLTDLLLALSLPFLDINPLNQWLVRNDRVRRLIEAGSRYSYSVYLIHFTVMGLMAWLAGGLTRLAGQVPLIGPSVWVGFGLSTVLLGVGVWMSFMVAKFLYYHVEEPGMRLRRFIPR